MTNEFGVKLDRAGYAPSVMQMIPRGRTCCCYLCGRPAGYNKLDRHEPWGAANRRKSMEHGLWVLLCHEGCHEGPGSVHGGNGAAARQLRIDAQTAAMLRYGWSYEEWIRRYGKSELTEEEAEDQIAGPGERIATAAVRPRNDEGNMEPPADFESDPSGAARHLPFARGALSRDGTRRAAVGVRSLSREGTPAADRPAGAGRGGCDFDRARAIIREFWPERAAAPRGGFQILDEPEMPF